LNEEEIGAALKQWFSMNPSVKREDLSITTKVWPHLAEPEYVEWSLNNSLKMLGTTTWILFYFIGHLLVQRQKRTR
jgi:diketogulonate reductase-like aldo/keto reductase